MIKKLLVGATILTTGAVATQSFAATGDVEATANFIQGIVLTPTATMDFGSVGFTAAAPAAGDQVNLGADASIAAAGNFSLEGGVPAAGTIDVVASAANLQIQCNATATLATATGETITVNNITYGYNATPAFGAGTVCDGTNALQLHTGGTDTISVGGRLDGSTYSAANYVAGVHNTTNASGVPITFTIVYQ